MEDMSEIWAKRFKKTLTELWAEPEKPKTLSALVNPSELSCQILNDLAVKYAKSGLPMFYPMEDLKLPDRSFESYGEEPKRFTWARLSSEYKWEDCI